MANMCRTCCLEKTKCLNILNLAKTLVEICKDLAQDMQIFKILNKPDTTTTMTMTTTKKKKQRTEKNEHLRVTMFRVSVGETKEINVICIHATKSFAWNV